MGIMKKLITKTNNFYLAFAIIALLLSAPIFYYISTAIYLEDVDESILLRQKKFVKMNFRSSEPKKLHHGIGSIEI
ncbi:MAG: hypothetical protein ACJAT1_001081 [Marivirga sp.]